MGSPIVRALLLELLVEEDAERYAQEHRHGGHDHAAEKQPKSQTLVLQRTAPAGGLELGDDGQHEKDRQRKR